MNNSNIGSFKLAQAIKGRFNIKSTVFIFFVLSLPLFQDQLFAQQDEEIKIIQFSGVITYIEQGEVAPLPYATIGVKGTARGTVSEYDGFFSIAIREGETIIVRSLGFKPLVIEIPKVDGIYYSGLYEMEWEAMELPLVEILPIPSREHFNIEFLAMNVDDPLRDRARDNLLEGLMSDIRQELPADGSEVARYELGRIAQSYYHYGQFKPQKILDVASWKRFIDAWQRGDFKKKKKDDEDN